MWHQLVSYNMKKTVISASPRKNIQMVVYHNVLGSGKKDSITRHEPLNPDKPVYRRAFGKGGRA